MSSQNLVSAALAPEAKEDIARNLGQAKLKLDFLLTLQADQIRGLYKASNGYAPFIEKAYAAAIEHPDILPGVFALEEFKKDYCLVKDLEPIGIQIDQLAEGIRNTRLAVNSDAMEGALEIYSAIKQHRDKVPGLNVLADEMAVFFKRTRRKEKKPPQ